jgi:CheY-like chemotaxis protein
MTPPRVLVVDNQWDTRYLCATLLERSGYRVVQVENGADAAEMLEHLRPDLIVLDPAASLHGGRDVLFAARSLSDCAVPVVALASAARGRDRSEAIAAGFAAFLTKPCNPHELEWEVRRLIGPGRAGSTLPGATAAA